MARSCDGSLSSITLTSAKNMSSDGSSGNWNISIVEKSNGSRGDAEVARLGESPSEKSGIRASAAGMLASADAEVASACKGYWHAIFRRAHRRHAGIAKSHLRFALVQAAQDRRRGGGLRLSSEVMDMLGQLRHSG